MSAEELFLGSAAGEAAYREAMQRATESVIERLSDRDAPYSGRSAGDLLHRSDNTADPETADPETADPETADPEFVIPEPIVPEHGRGVAAAIDEVAERVLPHSVRTSHPRCAAHLHCPPIVPGLAAEALLSAANQSLDSFDQAPAATVLERRVVEALCEVFDLPSGSDGVFTSGGTQSNFQALLLARDRYCRRRFGRDVRTEGLPSSAGSLRVLCSTEAHFTTTQAAHHLGLGTEQVLTVPTDGNRRMDPDALAATLEDLDDRGLDPFAVVGTAGTTDFGAIDPLDAIADHANVADDADNADRAVDRDLWFHVDAAYGGALALTDDHASLLDGIERADSIAVDFHKLFYQPISCGAFLLRDGEEFESMAHNAAYLNPEAHDDAGVPNLVGKSVQTTRRFDALKPYLTFRALGRDGVADLVTETLDLAGGAASLVEAAEDFELLGEPTLNTVVFRYRPRGGPNDRESGGPGDRESGGSGDRESGGPGDREVGRVNAAVRRRLLREGRAVVGRTEVDGVTSLKFTLLDPTATLEDVVAMLEAVRDCGERVTTDGEVAA